MPLTRGRSVRLGGLLHRDSFEAGSFGSRPRLLSALGRARVGPSVGRERRSSGHRSLSDVMEPQRNEAALSPARHGARLPGGAPEPFCERCGTSVEVAAIGPWVGLCHCPACDVFACRWCWEEATEACPECGTRYAPLVVAAAAVAPVAVVVEGVPAAEVLAATTPVVASPAAAVPVAAAAMAAGETVGAGVANPQMQAADPVAAAATLQAVRLLRTQRVPAGIGVAVLFVAIFALILGNPFQAGGVQGVLDATDTPSAQASGI